MSAQERLQRHSRLIPPYPAISNEDIDRIATALLVICQMADLLSRAACNEAEA